MDAHVLSLPSRQSRMSFDRQSMRTRFLTTTMYLKFTLHHVEHQTSTQILQRLQIGETLSPDSTVL